MYDAKPRFPRPFRQKQIPSNFSLAGQITSLEDNQFDPVTGKHKFVSVAIGIAKMVRFQNGLPQMNTQILVPVAGGVNVLNTFTSKKLN